MTGLTSLNDPARSLQAVTPSDTLLLPGGTCRALSALVAGNVVVIADGDTVAQTIYIGQGGVFPIQAKQVKETNTTATGILAMY